MKEFTWDIQLDGIKHHLLAVTDKRGSGYHLYDGDDYITNILPAVPFKMQIGIEQDFEIDGHTMTFVELTKYDPDIVYSGIMINSEREYAEEKEGFCKSKLSTYGTMLVFIIIIMIWYGVQSRLGGIVGAGIPGAFVIYKIIKFVKGMRRSKIKCQN